MSATWAQAVQSYRILVPVLAEDGEAAGIACPDCGGLMELHQPDAEIPDRLLGTCVACRRWVAIEFGAVGGTLMVALPSPAAWVEAGSPTG
jgi:hypothetical protein